MERYTSDYILGDPTFDSSPFQKYDEQIDKFQEMKFGLIKLCSYPGQTDEMRAKIQDVISNVNHYIKEFEEIRYKRYEEGVYKREWYSLGSSVKRNSQFIKRVDGDTCDGCVFSHMPCLNIRSHYGCYTTPEHSSNNEVRNGELVRQGHFIRIEPINNEELNG